jgi:hypothetical protein
MTIFENMARWTWHCYPYFQIFESADGAAVTLKQLIERIHPASFVIWLNPCS